MKDKALTLGQFLSFAFTILFAGVTAYLSTQSRIAVLEIQIRGADIDRGRIENKIDKMLLKQDKTDDNITELKILINTKQDKK